MAQLPTTTVFGSNFTQTASTITISKTDLQALCTSAGFIYTPSATDDAEKLFAAIIFAASYNLNSTNRAVDYVNRHIEINPPSYPSIVVQNSTNYQRDGWTIELPKQLMGKMARRESRDPQANKGHRAKMVGTA